MKIKWIGISIISLLLIGMGLSILGEAIILKNNDKSYFVMGTLALVIINSGLCFLGEAIILKTQLIEKDLVKK